MIFPPQERGKAIGFWAAAVGGAVALGPDARRPPARAPEWFNWLTGNDWGSVFFINVPIVIIGIIGIVLLVPETKNPHDPASSTRSVSCSRSSACSLLVYGIQEAASGG